MPPKGVPSVKLKRLSGGSGFKITEVAAERIINSGMEVQYNIPTRNPFGALCPDNIAGPSGTLHVPKPDKLEHFIVPREKISELANIKSIVGLFNWRRLRNGDMKILPATADGAEKIKVEVDKLGWYSHSNQKDYKYVAYGLPPMNPVTLVTLINQSADNQVLATHASRMTIRKPLYPDQANYLVHFNKNPTLPVLREVVTSINGAIPSWAHYRVDQNAQRPSRCTNCQKPFHGSRGCHLPPACGVCAGQHNTPTCPLLLEKRRQNKERIDPQLLKCANCGGNHTAGYSGCSALQQRSFKPRGPSAWQRPPPLPSDVNNFPGLPQRKGAPVTSQSSPQSPNVSHGSLNNNLFSLNELQSIMTDILSNLSNCKTKADQFNLMFNLAAKYVYGP